MKTVVHWKELGKCALVVLTVGVAIALMQIPGPLGFLVSVAGGVGAMAWSMARWETFHFE